MLYQIQDGTLSFGEKTILSHIDMEIKGKEKIGIVGSNGTGKTSLMKLIAGELSLDRDDKRQGRGITSSRQLKIAKMDQDHSAYLNRSVEEILLSGFYESTGERVRGEEKLALDYSSDRFFYEQRYDQMLQDFGFFVKDKEKLFGEFSGGEQTKLMLVKLLLTEADILLLDEPTNHLDGESVEALEAYVSEYPGAVVVVSHDRYFLDRIAEVIYELEDAHLTRYVGNYSFYRKEKRNNYERQLKAYERQQEEIQRNEQLIKQFKNKPRKASFARSRKTMLDRMERIEKPKADLGHIFTGELSPAYPGPKWTLQMEDLRIGYQKGEPLSGVLNLRIRRGAKIGILGKNGIGKTTFLKTLVGLMPALKGSYQFGEKVEIGYFDQSSGQMDSEEKVVDHFKKLFPGMLEKDVYGKLAAFLFKGSISQQKVNTLSGGEKARLALCELLTLCPNCLILDEPTNHMDIPAKETLESAFQAYTGTMLVVSHDRYFLDQVADAMLVFEEDGVYYYPFGYSHYIQSKRKMEKLLSKGVSLDELPGMLSAQEQAMVESLKAVPKAARIASKPLTDEEAYVEWKLGLAQEPLAEAAANAADSYERYQKLENLRMSRIFVEDGILDVPESEEYIQAKQELENAMEAYTSACLEWFETVGTFLL